jgi:hypothetical protein
LHVVSPKDSVLFQDFENDKNSGACCTGVSKESTNGVCGEIGYKIYDDGTKRQLGVITSDIKGKMIDLRNYY